MQFEESVKAEERRMAGCVAGGAEDVSRAQFEAKAWFSPAPFTACSRKGTIKRELESQLAVLQYPNFTISHCVSVYFFIFIFVCLFLRYSYLERYII